MNIDLAIEILDLEIKQTATPFQFFLRDCLVELKTYKDQKPVAYVHPLELGKMKSHSHCCISMTNFKDGPSIALYKHHEH